MLTTKSSKKDLAKARAAYEAARKRMCAAADRDASGAAKDVLADFAAFSKYERAGFAAMLSFSAPTQVSWTDETEKAVFGLTKDNMLSVYDAAPGPGWKWNDSKKRGELFSDDSRYILARSAADGALVGFLSFRFVQEGEFDVLYVYELQTAAAAQRKGLGKRMMQVAELIARKQGMQKVMLTVLRNNRSAVDFYAKLKYAIDPISPSASDEEAAHEILSKVVDPAAFARAERIRDAFAAGKIPEDAPEPTLVAGVPQKIATSGAGI